MYEKEGVCELSHLSENLIRVGNYYRLSDEDKDKINKSDDSESIKNQKQLLREEVKKHNDWILVDEYCDEDLSGAGTYRPEFERLIKDCENGKIDIVLCKTQARFTRDMELVEKYLHNKFHEWNVRFIGLVDNADTSNNGNKKQRQIVGLTNEWFLEDLSNNIRAAFDIKMQKGEYISPFTPYGYQLDPNDNNKIIIDSSACEVVKEIYDMYLGGFGYELIARRLNKKGISSPALYKHLKGLKINILSKRPIEELKWNTNAIKTILKNKIYAGTLIQGKRTTLSYKNKKIIKRPKHLWKIKDNNHEAIIDLGTWEIVQSKIKSKSRISRRTGKVHLFSGKVFCDNCKHYMKRKTTERHEYLICTSNRDGYDDCVNKSSMRYDILNNIVLDEINKLFVSYYDKSILEKGKSSFYLKSEDNKIKSLEQEKFNFIKIKEKNEEYLKNLYEDKINGIITTDQFIVLQKKYDSEFISLQNQVESINEKIENLKAGKDKMKPFKALFEKYKKIKKLDRIIIDEFIDSIYIGKYNKDTNERPIKIKWNF